MAGGGGGALGMRLNVMTALYLPILGYAMSTFELNPDALIISSDNLFADAIPIERTVRLGDTFEAKIMYELVPTPEQKAQLEALARGEAKGEAKSHTKVFEPSIIIDTKNSPDGMYFDSVEKRIYLNTEKLSKQFKDGEFQKTFNYKLDISAKTVAGEGFYKTVNNSFSVFKPFIEVQSNAAPRLFANSKNALKFNVPGVDPNTLVLNDKASGMEIKGSTIEWSPNGDTTVISVSYTNSEGDKIFVGTKGFRITPTPAPKVYLRRENGEILQPGSNASWPDLLELVIEADESFMKDFPQDSKYSIDGITMEIVNLGVQPTRLELSRQDIRDFRSNKGAGTGQLIYELDFYKLPGGLPNGIGINIQLNKVNRINFQNRPFEVDPNTIPSNFSLSMR